MRLLIVTSVEKEARAIGEVPGDAHIVVSGIGRTNAACATIEAILTSGPFDAVINVGIAGALPRADGAAVCAIGDVILASESVYAEEGLISPDGFGDVAAIGFPLGPFPGNAVPCNAALVDRLREGVRVGRIATVATCSGTDAAAREIAARTDAIAEAMEGAAVVHAAMRHDVPAVELRVISNTTGDRDRQRWELARALDTLGSAVRSAIERLRRG